MSMFQVPSGGAVPSWSFADRLRKAREYADMEQGDLAPLILKKRSTLSAWENGKHRPDELTLRAIAFHTGVSFDWLATGKVDDDGPDGGDSVTTDGGVDASSTKWEATVHVLRPAVSRRAA